MIKRLKSWGHSEIRESPHPRQLPDPEDYMVDEPDAIEVEAFPDGRKGHVDGECCPCRPFRDAVAYTLLVHRKVGTA